MIFNDEGMPRTVGISLGWTILLALFTGGFVFLFWGIYLAYWTRTKRGRGAAVWCYLIFLMIAILGLLVPGPSTDAHIQLIWNAVAAAGVVLVLVTPLILRSEIISLYRASYGLDLIINPFLTILFSSAYLNYCLPDMPVELLASIASRQPSRQ
jgi:hypothetical protein